MVKACLSVQKRGKRWPRTGDGSPCLGFSSRVGVADETEVAYARQSSLKKKEFLSEKRTVREVLAGFLRNSSKRQRARCSNNSWAGRAKKILLKRAGTK